MPRSCIVKLERIYCSRAGVVVEQLERCDKKHGELDSCLEYSPGFKQDCLEMAEEQALQNVGDSITIINLHHRLHVHLPLRSSLAAYAI